MMSVLLRATGRSQRYFLPGRTPAEILQRTPNLVTNFETILEHVKQGVPKTIVVVAAEDRDVLTSTSQAAQQGIARFLYVGDADKITQLAAHHQLELAGSEIIQAGDPEEAGNMAIDAIKRGNGHALMKGKISTGQLLGMVLKDSDLKQQNPNQFLSHVTIFQWQNQLKILTDPGLNIAPSLDQKKKIALNAIQVARQLGTPCPKVAFLSAVEKVSPKMLSSVEAAELAKATWHSAIVDGPLAFDGAMFEEAYRIKGAPSPLRGNADVLVCPNIEMANAIYKIFAWMLKLDLAGVITGAAIPCILSSRADNARVKFLSIATALYLSERKEQRV